MFRLRRRLAAPALACALAASGGALAACPSTDLLWGGPDDAGVETSVDAEAEGATDADCAHARVPGKPEVSDPTEVEPILFALRKLSTTSIGDGGPLGYDIDGKCGCENGAAVTACNAPAKACQPEGRDIATADLAANYMPTLYEANNAGIERGGTTTLFEIRGWNGKPDDDLINVRIYLSNGTVASADGGPFVEPRWDGTDVWSTDAFSAAGGGEPFAEVGWVRDNVAVVEGAKLNGLLVPLVRGGQIDINDVRLTGRIVDVSGHKEIVDGQIAGRMSSTQLLTTLRLRPLPDGGCVSLTGSGYDVLKNVVCNYRDVMTFKQLDDTGRDCDALSYAATFVAVQASSRGPVAPTPPGCENARIVDDCR